MSDKTTILSRGATVLFVLCIGTLALIGGAIIAVLTNRISESFLWAIKGAGALFTVSAGVLGIFTDEAIKNNRLTRLGWTLGIVIFGGAALSLVADRAKEQQDAEDAQVLLTHINTTLADVDRQLYPFTDVRFVVTLKVNLDYPAFAALKSNLPKVAQRLANDLQALRPGDVASFPDGYGGSRGKDGTLYLTAQDSAPIMPQLDVDGQAAELLFDPHLSIDIYKTMKPSLDELRRRKSDRSALISHDYHAELATDTQDLIHIVRLRSLLHADLKYLLYFNIKSGECTMSLFDLNPNESVGVKSESGTLVGITDLQQAKLVFRVAAEVQKRWPADPPLELAELDMLVGSRIWYIPKERFDAYSDESGFRFYTVDIPPDNLVGSFTIVPDSQLHPSTILFKPD